MAIDRSRQTKWDAENLERFTTVVPKGTRDMLKTYADERGLAFNRLVINALESYTGLTISRKTKPADE